MTTVTVDPDGTIRDIDGPLEDSRAGHPRAGYGALAAALAKAQAAFPAISRDREVTVQMKSGGSYTFKYAPLDTILAAVRAPLADNGLAIVQLLDEDVLVTSLLHESGAILSGRTPIPQTEGIQAYGSAITYLRRYAIQALLGIAAEEDDDGNRAAGNDATTRTRVRSRGRGNVVAGPTADSSRTDSIATSEPLPKPGPATVTGTVSVGKTAPVDCLLRQSPDGPYIGFRIFDEARHRTQVIAKGALADDLWDTIGHDAAKLHGQQVTVEGMREWDEFTDKDRRTIRYSRIIAGRIVGPGWMLNERPPDGPEILPGEAATHFTFPDGTVGPGKWDPKTGQVESAIEDAANEAYHDAVDAELDAIAEGLP